MSRRFLHTGQDLLARSELLPRSDQLFRHQIVLLTKKFASSSRDISCANTDVSPTILHYHISFKRENHPVNKERTFSNDQVGGEVFIYKGNNVGNLSVHIPFLV